MDAAVCLDGLADLSHLEPEGHIFEWLLHVSPSEHTQVATFGRTPAL